NLEEEVNRKTEEIRKLLKQKDEFISQLGHDLKTPLTPIVSLLPIIRERIKDDDVKKLVDVVIRNANYMKNLVTDTLRLAQLNSRDYRFNLEDLDLHDVVEESIEDNRYLLMEKNISPENRIPRGVIVRADKLRLKEVFANLISNSIRYTPEGGRIEFRAREEGNEVMVEVRDNGRGLSEEEKERIFDEFYKVDRSRRDLDTSGLGLTICKKIVERHGGRIWAESDGLGKGTSICFTLPLQKFNKR
ncbi:MAG TPA: HAMP domain-containing histidine kinase, partial [Thermoplasmatales archaeon]|nr:HAMP domain-containing histidine kinase [Thermoplasmatales archaeon]HEX16984.1 HAMP domain-containing histidine kinase [Thermoplasmatales archaeon]